jgi:hypothetical protein
MRTVGLPALAAALSGFIGLWLLRPRPILIVLGIAIQMFIVSGVGLKYLLPLLDAGHAKLAGLVLGGSIATIAWTLYRLVHVREDDPEFHIRWRSMSTVRPRMTGETNQAWTDARRAHQFFLAGGGRVFIPSAATIWQGARRWLSIGGSGIWFYLLMAVMMVASIELMSHADGNPVDSVFPMVAIWMNFLPGAFAAGSWSQRWRFMEIELLRPIDRASLLKQVGLAIGLDILRAWFIMSLIVVIDAVYITSRPPNLPMLACALAASLGFQVMGFGLSAWLMRYRAQSWILIFVAVTMVPGILAVAVIGDPSLADYRNYALATTVAFVAAGLFIARDAYKRWLVTEWA